MAGNVSSDGTRSRRIPELTERMLRTRCRTGMHGIRLLFRASQSNDNNGDDDDDDGDDDDDNDLCLHCSVTTLNVVYISIKGRNTFE